MVNYEEFDKMGRGEELCDLLIEKLKGRPYSFKEIVAMSETNFHIGDAVDALIEDGMVEERFKDGEKYYGLKKEFRDSLMAGKR